jgi:trigger factor
MVFGKFEELDGEGKVKESGITNSSVIIINAVTDKNLQKQLVGAKAGDKFIVDPKTVSEHESDQAQAIGVDVNELKNIISKFNYTVEKVNRVIASDLNQELFDKIFGEGAVKSEKEFRDKIAEELNKGLIADSDRKLKADVQDALMDSLKLKLPDTFLKKWIKASNEKPITDEQIEAEYDMYSKSLQWQLIENKIIEANEIKVEFEEVIAYTKGLLTQQMQSMGMPANDDEQLTQTAQSVLQNQEEARKIYGMLYDSKLMDLYKSTCKLKEKQVSLEEFEKLLAKQK